MSQKIGFKHSEETKSKLREKNIGKKLSEITKKLISKNNAKFWLGKKRPSPSKQTRKKIGLSLLGRKRKPLSEEHKRKISESEKGRKQPIETKLKISLGLKGMNKSKEHIKKLSGENHWNWRGGVSYEIYSFDWTKTLKQSIRERDKFTCQLCGKLQKERAFCIHHIDYNKKNCNPNNLITLCMSCHSKTNINREYWINYFNELYG